MGEAYEPNIEAIAALRPDLIVGDGYDGKGIRQELGDPAGLVVSIVQMNAGSGTPTSYLFVDDRRAMGSAHH